MQLIQQNIPFFSKFDNFHSIKVNKTSLCHSVDAMRRNTNNKKEICNSNEFHFISYKQGTEIINRWENWTKHECNWLKRDPMME